MCLHCRLPPQSVHCLFTAFRTTGETAAPQGKAGFLASKPGPVRLPVPVPACPRDHHCDAFHPSWMERSTSCCLPSCVFEPVTKKREVVQQNDENRQVPCSIREIVCLLLPAVPRACAAAARHLCMPRCVPSFRNFRMRSHVNAFSCVRPGQVAKGCVLEGTQAHHVAAVLTLHRTAPAVRAPPPPTLPPLPLRFILSADHPSSPLPPPPSLPLSCILAPIARIMPSHCAAYYLLTTHPHTQKHVLLSFPWPFSRHH